MLNRLRTGPWLRVIFIAVVAACCARGLVAEWPQARSALGRLQLFPVIIAGVMAAAGSGCMLLAWRTLLADLGSALPVKAATRVISVSQLGKYLPGAVWAFAAQVELAGDYAVPKRRCATTVVTSTTVTLAVGLVLACVALPLTSSAAAARYWWLLAVAPLALVILYPPVLSRLMNRVLAILKRPSLECRPTLSGLARAALWTALGWTAWGTQIWLLLHEVTGKGPAAVLLAIGAYALAWSAGTIMVIFPGGIGPRELALVAALAPVAAHGPALVVAVTSRVLMTASDLVWAAAGLIIGRMLIRQARRDAPSDEGLALAADAKPGKSASEAPGAVPVRGITPDPDLSAAS